MMNDKINGIRETSLFKDITAQESETILGGGLLDWIPTPSGVYIDPDGNPNTHPNYYFGDFNQKPTEWKDVKVDIRVGGNTVYKSYGYTSGAILDWAKSKFK